MKAMTLLLFVISITAGQPQFTKVIELQNRSLPFERRVECSGIYSVASFDVVGGILYLSSFNSPDIFAYQNERFSSIHTADTYGSDFIIDKASLSKHGVTTSDINESHRNNVILRKSPEGNRITNIDGVITYTNGQKIIVTVPNRSQLSLSLQLQYIAMDIVIPFPGNLGYAECLGLDSGNNLYILAETYIREVPLLAARFIYVLSPEGSIRSIVKVPVGNQASLVKEFIVNGSGEVYHLFAFGDVLHLLKWSGLNSENTDTLYYPEEYYRSQHQNDILPSENNAPVSMQNSNPGGINKPQYTVSRNSALRIAEKYVLHTYSVSAANLAPNGVTAPDGYYVKTPGWLVAGVNAHIPYKWMGFNSLSEFDSLLGKGYYAGNINTNGSGSVHVAGIDCLGFVCRCWNIDSQTGLTPYTIKYQSWDELKPADAMHTSTHERLFVERTPNGGFKIAEASGRHWDVSYWTYSLSQLSTYIPWRYIYMQTDFAKDHPVLQSVLANSDTSVTVRWSGDTSGVLGYRLYASSNGESWNLLKDESTLNAESTMVSVSDSVQFFRVSHVLNNVDRSESDLSNVLGACIIPGIQRSLIVDGFHNETGSWQGSGHTFVMRYGKAIARMQRPFESVCNSEILSGQAELYRRPMVCWFTGDELAKGKTISAVEQTAIKSYLESGGALLINGSEIGYALWEDGSAQDRDFYTNYLKAKYIFDDAEALTVHGVDGSIFAGQSFRFGQNYVEEFPDVIEPTQGSISCLKYSNEKGAGIQYFGTFSTSLIPSKLVYIGFPIETIANDSNFNTIIASMCNYGLSYADEENARAIPDEFCLTQNFPNPFNPSTTIRYAIPAAGTNTRSSQRVILKIYDLLGREIETLVNDVQSAGWKEVQWNASSIASGMYFYKLQAGDFVDVKKLMLVK